MLDWYDYGARYYNPSIGLFTTHDPKAEVFFFQSPYVYAANDPVKHQEKNGENPILGAIAGGLAEYGAQVVGNVATQMLDGASWSDVDWKKAAVDDIDVYDVVASTVEGALTCGASVTKKLVITSVTTVTKNALDVKSSTGVTVNSAGKVIKDTVIDGFTAGLPSPKVGKTVEATAIKIRQKTRKAGGQMTKGNAKKIARKKLDAQQSVIDVLPTMGYGGSGNVAKTKSDDNNPNPYTPDDTKEKKTNGGS